MIALNFGSSAFDVEKNLPEKFKTWVARDEKYIKSLLESGHPPKIDWERAKRELEARMFELVGRRVPCKFINIDTPSQHRFWNDSSFDGGYEILCVRTNHMVLLCCPSSKLSAELHCKARDACEFFPFVDDHIREMIEEIHTKQQAKNWPNFIANFGLSTRNQPPGFGTNPIVAARNAASKMVRFAHRMVNHVTESFYDFAGYAKEVYEKHCLPVYPFDENQRQYVRRFHGDGNAQRRLREDFRSHNLFTLRSLMNSSLPLISEKGHVDIATFENKCRTLSEWLMLHAFPSLPLANTLYIAARNARESFVQCTSFDGSAYGRVFPRGSISQALHGKGIHDDKNGAYSPSMWTNLTDSGHDEYISFFLKGMTVTLRCTLFRVVYFMGNVSHATFTTRVDPSIRSKRVSLSAYTKEELEYVGCVMLAEERRAASLNHIQCKTTAASEWAYAT